MILRCALLAGIVVMGVRASSVAATPNSLTVALPPGPLVHVLTEAFTTPFSQSTGANVAVVATDGSLAAARDAHADVAILDAATIAAGCKDGSLQKLDWGALGGRDRTLPGTAGDCSLGAVVRSTVLAWNKEKFTGQPTWAEFWDVARVPGKRALRRGARTNLEIALLADGVAPADVYTTLHDDAGVERAFRKLDQLKPYLVWWSGPDDPPRLLVTGEVLMTSAPAETIVAAQRGEGQPAHPSFAVQWRGSLATVDSWAALKGASAAAPRFLAFAADPKTQARLPALGAYGGTVTGATDGLKPDLVAASPSAPANIGNGLMLDEAFWRDNGARLDKQFEAWMAK